MDGGQSAAPLLRAGLIQPVLAAVRRFDDKPRDRMLERIGEERLKAIDDASRTSWVTFELMLGVDAALHDELGEEGFVEFWRDFVARVAEVPLLRPLAEGASRLFSGPRTLFRMLPRAYGLALRNLGELTFEADPSENKIEIQLSGVPPLSSPGLFASACKGSFWGVLRLMDLEGTVDVDAWGADAGRFRFFVSWES